jgi:hypoxia up-regulated 1
VRDLLDDDNSQTPFKKCSQESERKTIAQKLEESIAWLHEKGDYADTAQLLDKRNALEYVSFFCRWSVDYNYLRVLEQPIVHRYREIEAFPQTLNMSQMWNWNTRMFLVDARTNLTIESVAGFPSKWTKEELDGLEKTLKEHEAWLDEWVEKQKSVKINEDPVISTTEMKARAKTLETHLQRLAKRKVPKPRKTTTTAATSSTTATTSTSGEADSSTVVSEPIAETSKVPLRVQDEL